LVYCQKCGTLNEDTTLHCSNCGASLSEQRRSPQKEVRDECFGLPQGGNIFTIIIGIVIILVGAQSLLGWDIDFGPFMIIIVGILIVAGSLYQRNKSKR
jgi:uncharacterized membrane protein YvbJ